MLVTQGDIFSVASGLTTILQIREVNTYQRAFYFRNLGASDLSVQIEESADGGGTWSIVGTAFTVSATGGSSDVVVRSVDSSNILRVRASGGAADRDLRIDYARFIKDSGHIWVAPLL